MSWRCWTRGLLFRIRCILLIRRFDRSFLHFCRTRDMSWKTWGLLCTSSIITRFRLFGTPNEKINDAIHRFLTQQRDCIGLAKFCYIQSVDLFGKNGGRSTDDLVSQNEGIVIDVFCDMQLITLVTSYYVLLIIMFRGSFFCFHQI